MSGIGAPTRDDVVRMLTAYHGEDGDPVSDQIDSLELAWLLHALEERYGVQLATDEDVLERMTTVDVVVAEVTRLIRMTHA